MSSSTSALSRSRSLRKPVNNNSNTTTANISSNGASSSSSTGGITTTSGGGGTTESTAVSSGVVRDGGPRTLSPTRLPVKGSSSLARSASIRTVSSATNSSAGGGRGEAPSSPSSTAAPTRRTRPLSGVLGRSRPEPTASKEDNSSTGTGDVLNSRPPRTASTRGLIGGGGGGGTTGQTRPPSSSGPLTRSNSMARPTTSSGVPSSSGSRLTRAPSGHARTKSSITTLTGATTLRPPSQTSADSGSSSTGTTAATTTGGDRSRPPITRSSAVTHRRNISNSSAMTSTTTSTSRPTSKQPASSSTSRQPPQTNAPATTSTDHLQNPHRPAFSTLQQHYSPAKSLAPKPLTSTFLAPPSPSKLPSNVALSAEIARLQTELLQLHLLHRDAHTVDGQWRTSAKSRLGDRFIETVRSEQQVSKIEESVVEMSNLKALVDWGDSTGEGLESRIQMLDEVICGLWAMGEPVGGRYTRVVRRFEKWIVRVKEVSEARKLFDRIRAGEGENEQITGELLGNEGLGDLLLLVTTTTTTTTGNSGSGSGKTAGVLLDGEWKDECASLTRRLKEWRRILKDLTMGIPGEEVDDTNGTAKTAGVAKKGEGSSSSRSSSSSGSSSLSRILKACRGLVDDMLAELELMEQIERDAVAAENAWVRAVNRDQDEHGEDLLLRRGGGGNNSTRAGAIWRAL